jgi:hypothetical protein
MADGSMVGFEGAAAQASSILVAHLIMLLMTHGGIYSLSNCWPESPEMT